MSADERRWDRTPSRGQTLGWIPMHPTIGGSGGPPVRAFSAPLHLCGRSPFVGLCPSPRSSLGVRIWVGTTPPGSTGGGSADRRSSDRRLHSGTPPASEPFQWGRVYIVDYLMSREAEVASDLNRQPYGRTIGVPLEFVVMDVGPLPSAGVYTSPPEGGRPTRMTNSRCTRAEGAHLDTAPA